jgi:hypothetical protein
MIRCFFDPMIRGRFFLHLRSNQCFCQLQLYSVSDHIFSVNELRPASETEKTTKRSKTTDFLPSSFFLLVPDLG